MEATTVLEEQAIPDLPPVAAADAQFIPGEPDPAPAAEPAPAPASVAAAPAEAPAIDWTVVNATTWDARAGDHALTIKRNATKKVYRLLLDGVQAGQDMAHLADAKAAATILLQGGFQLPASAPPPAAPKAAKAKAAKAPKAGKPAKAAKAKAEKPAAPAAAPAAPAADVEEVDTLSEAIEVLARSQPTLTTEDLEGPATPAEMQAALRKAAKAGLIRKTEHTVPGAASRKIAVYESLVHGQAAPAPPAPPAPEAPAPAEAPATGLEAAEAAA